MITLLDICTCLGIEFSEDSAVGSSVVVVVLTTNDGVICCCCIVVVSVATNLAVVTCVVAVSLAMD